MQSHSAKAGTRQQTIVLSVVLVLATLLAGVAGSLVLSYLFHRDYHDDIVATVESRAEQLEETVAAHLVASTRVVDALDKRAVARAWLLGSGREMQEVLREVYPLAREANVRSMTVIGRDERVFASIGEAPRARVDSVPLNESEHVWLYWDDGWWLEHHVEIRDNGVSIAEWIAQIRVRGLYDVAHNAEAFTPGAFLAVCAFKDGDYPCLSMPAEGERPTFYIGEDAFCLSPGCEGGSPKEEFSRAHGMLTAYKALEAFNVSMIYYVPLEAFFQQELAHERFGLLAVLLVALGGVGFIYRQARPLARDLARTTVHMQEIMSKLPESVISINDAGVVCAANPATRWMFGYEPDELIGKPVDLLIPGAYRESHMVAMARRRITGKGGDGGTPLEAEARRRDGSVFPIELLTSEYEVEGERLAIGIIRDIRQRKRHEESLRKWAHVFEHAEWGIAVCSGEVDEGVIEFMNPAFAQMFGASAPPPTGQLVKDMLPPESRAELIDCARRADLHGHHSHEARQVRSDGSEFYGLIDVTSMKDDRGRVAYRVIHVRDISVRRQAEETLRRSEARLANAQRIARLGDWEWNIASDRLKWSAETFRLLGYMVDQIEPSSRIFMEAVVADDRDRVSHAVARALEDGRPYSIDYRVRRIDGAERVFHEEGEVVHDGDGKPLRMVGTLQDVTEMKRRQVELEEQRAQLRELTANRDAVREQERTRIAREIHDELGQSLTTLRMQAALLGLGHGARDPQLAKQVDDIKALIDQTIIVVRNVATKLRPGALDLGIASAMEWLAQDFEERTGILCGLDIDPHLQEAELEDPCATMLFRILQESLTNVVRHANASHVEIRFSDQNGYYQLEVSDDGVGFDPNAPSERKTFGLLGIRERATVLGGKVTITSAVGAGTTLDLRVPI